MSQTAEQALMMYQRISQARNNETMRVADLIEVAMHETESDEVREALLNLAIKVLRP